MAAGLIRMEGDNKLHRVFKQLNVKPREIRAVTRGAGNIVKNRARKIIAKADFDDSEGTLKESIVVTTSKKYNGVWVGPNYGRYKGKRGSHFHLVAFDFTRSSGKRSTDHPIGQVIHQAAADVDVKIRKSMGKRFGSLLMRKIRKV